ncbi:MAG: sulfite exporter TauE/SafE family protein [Planctomycetota bacterium]|nr:sulfite exporter TauE/SafE family protein [Planctomycetota bacterium]
MLIATIAMASGIGGAVFFSPLFMLVLKLEPSVAIGTALTTELFGFSSGLVAYWRRRLIDFKLGRDLLLFSVPAAIVGSLTAEAFPAVILKTIFAVGIIFIGSQLYSSLKREEREKLDQEIGGEAQRECESILVDRSGKEYCYTIRRKDQGRLFAAIGGAFLGAISVGLAELQEYHLMVRCRVPPPVAVATSIFVVVVSVLVASLGHFYHFATSADPQMLTQVRSVVMFTIPGVIVGGQLGPLVQARVNPDLVKLGIAILFITVGIFMLTTVV